MCAGFFPPPPNIYVQGIHKDNKGILLALASSVSRKMHVSVGGKEPTGQVI